jgi:hypothetical protein
VNTVEDKVEEDSSAVYLPAVLGMVCVVLGGIVFVNPGSETFCLMTGVASMLGVTNICWVVWLPEGAGKKIHLALWVPWLVNNVVAGSTMTWAVWAIAGAPGSFWVGTVAVTWLIIGMISAVFLRAQHGWKLIGILGTVGMAMLIAAIIFGVASADSQMNGWTRFGLRILAAALGLAGAAQGIPLGIGAVILARRFRKKTCVIRCDGCGEDLYDTFMAGKCVCPRCGVLAEGKSLPASGGRSEGSG